MGVLACDTAAVPDFVEAEADEDAILLNRAANRHERAKNKEDFGKSRVEKKGFSIKIPQ